MTRPPRRPAEPSGADPLFEVAIATFEDVILARQKVKNVMQEMAFSVLARTRMVTAVSELARNIVVHAGGGTMTVEKTAMAPGRGEGVVCRFTDDGPGIPDIDQALQPGFSTSNSMGLGLSGARKLCKSFSIASGVGEGTRVVIGEWK